MTSAPRKHIHGAAIWSAISATAFMTGVTFFVVAWHSDYPDLPVIIGMLMIVLSLPLLICAMSFIGDHAMAMDDIDRQLLNQLITIDQLKDRLALFERDGREIFSGALPAVTQRGIVVELDEYRKVPR